MNFDDPTPSRRDGMPIAHIFEIWEREKVSTTLKFVPKGQLTNTFAGVGNNDYTEFHPVSSGTGNFLVRASIPTNEFAGYMHSVPPGRFIPPLFPRKRGGQVVSLGH